jgi:hypothetical protein
MRRFTLFFVCIALMIGGGILAQDETIPLLDMLALVPDTPDSRTEIYYADSTAISEAYPGAEIPADMAQFEASRDVEEASDAGFGNALWWSVFLNYSTTSPNRANLLSVAETMPDIVGFGFFDIEREITYGTPPRASAIFSLRSNLQLVRDAFSNQGFTQADNPDAELWCGAVGCEGGTNFNPAERLSENPFGGDLGRQQPMVIGDGFLMSSPALEIVEAHINATNNAIPSLADNPDYAAAVSAAAGYGPLLQAFFLDGSLLLDVQTALPIDPSMLARADRQERRAFIDSLLARFEDGAETLPAYNLLMFADTANNSQHLALVLLTYNDQSSAELAAEILPDRILSAQSMMTRRPLAELLAERRVDDITAEVVEADNGKFVVVLRLGTLKGTAEEVFDLRPGNFDTAEIAPPGITYRMLLQGVFSRDLSWLSTVPVEEQQALLEEMANE